MEHEQRPVLIYDGDCAFCAYWVRYWQRLSGEAVVYLPWQRAARHYPGIPQEEFVRSIQLLTPDGVRYSGAEAAARVLAGSGHPWSLRCYRSLPGCAWLSERFYRLIAGHRTGAAGVARLLWGPERYPTEYQLVSWLFLRFLALIYLAAFASFGIQAEGLIGSQGILPLQQELEAMNGEHGTRALLLYPGVFWLAANDAAIVAVCLGGAVASLLLFGNVLTRLMLPLLFVLYLSLVYAGQVFMNFQWDFLLLEAGFLAIFLPWGSPVIIWLFHWVLFRVRFLSGLAKLQSGDEAWANFTALEYYFETQPLAHVGGWLAHQLPDWLLRAGVGWVFFVELLVPFLVFLPRNPRMFAAWATIIMQVLIMLTSNHNFFNLLTIVLCLLLFDDRALQRWRLDRLPGGAGRVRRAVSGAVMHPPAGRPATWTAAALALLIVSSTLSMLWSTVTGRALPVLNEPVVRALVQWHVINNYHVFPVITTERPELIVEGSRDGREWQAYGFRYKPGELTRRPRFNIPHQPRLDWQLWFVALSPPFTRVSYWFPDFAQRLLEGSPTVLGFLEHNPFPGEPPQYLRARLERYRFTTPAEKRATGQWWASEPIGIYMPPVTLEMLRYR